MGLLIANDVEETDGVMAIGCKFELDFSRLVEVVEVLLVVVVAALLLVEDVGVLVDVLTFTSTNKSGTGIR